MTAGSAGDGADHGSLVRSSRGVDREGTGRGRRIGRCGWTLQAGESRDLVLEIMTWIGRRLGSPSTPTIAGPAPRRRGGQRCRRCTDTVATVDVRQSFAVLRGMTGPDGGTVAAATTSLPERSDAQRNYDYRYCWLRDICYIGHAGAAVDGGEAVLDDAVRWVSARLLADGTATIPGLPLRWVAHPRRTIPRSARLSRWIRRHRQSGANPVPTRPLR